MSLDPTESRITESVEVNRPSPAVQSPNRRARRTSSNRAQRRKLRLIYFSLAALWGFLIGTAAVLFGLSLGGISLDLSPGTIVALAVSSILAVVGGMIASRAYREATRRRR